MKRAGGSFVVAAWVIVFTLFAAACARQEGSAALAVTPSPSTAKLEAAYGRLPLHFEENRGQLDAAVQFVGRTRGGTVYLTTNEVILDVADRPLRFEWLNAQPPRTTPEHRLAGRVNYLIGADPSRWRTDIPTFARVRYEGLYPGVAALFYGTERHLEYDLIVEPGADPSRIAFRVHGADGVQLNGDGNLLIRVAEHVVVQHAPVVYQDGPDGRERIDGRYVINGPDHVSFWIGTYDRTRALVIDPVVSYATFVGGSGVSSGVAVAVDTAGNAYVTGHTTTGFPTTNTISPNGSVFVTKLNAAGSAMVYSTIVGGSHPGDEVSAIAVDSQGSAYITGRALSTDFPVVNAFQPVKAEPFGSFDGFITKLNPAGNGLVYSSYIGGSNNQGDQRGWAIAVDATGHAYVGGSTGSPNFPTTPGAFQATKPAGSSGAGWVAKVHPSGTSLVYSTYLGGTGSSSVEGLAIDGAGNAYVGGATSANDFPTTPGAIKPSPGGTAFQLDGFVAKLNPTGSGLVYSTRIGGTGPDSVYGIAVKSGEAYVTGATNSTDFPTVNAFQGSLNGTQDAFVARLNASGTGLIYSTYLGGSETTTPQTERGLGIAVDSAGSAAVVGWTNSSDFPVMNPVSTGAPAAASGFVTQLSPTGALTSSQFSTRVGVTADGVALDTSDAIYVTGTTHGELAATPGAAQPTSGGSEDAYVVKLPNVSSGGGGGGDTTKPTVAITMPSNGAWTGNSINVAVTASDDTGLQDIKLWGNGKVFGTIPCSGTTCSGDVWWGTGVLTAAAYEVNAVATDKAGNQTISATVTIYKDAKSPVVSSGATVTGGGGGGGGLPPLTATISSPANGATVAGSTTVAFSASGAQGKPVFVVKVDNNSVLYSGNAPGGGSSVSTTWDTQFGTNGTHTLNLTVQDEAGRTATAVVSVNVSNPGGSTADTQKPNVAITSPASGAWTGNSITVGAHAVDNVAVANIKFWAKGAVFGTVTCGGPTCDGAVTWATGPLPPGAYEVNAVATDKAGNQFISTAITIYKDAKSPFYPSGVSTSSPTLGATFAKPASGATLSGTAVVQLNATGVTAGSTLTYTLKIDGVVPAAQGPITASCNQPTCVAAWSWDTTKATNGPHTLSGTVSDTGGHTATTTVSVTVSNTTGGGGGDTIAPTVAITSPSNGAWTGNSIRVAASATDNVLLSTLKFYGNGTQFGQLTCGTATCSGEQWWTTGSLPSGKHTITVVATDSVGNQTTSAPVVINK